MQVADRTVFARILNHQIHIRPVWTVVLTLTKGRAVVNHRLKINRQLMAAKKRSEATAILGPLNIGWL